MLEHTINMLSKIQTTSQRMKNYLVRVNYSSRTDNIYSIIGDIIPLTNTYWVIDENGDPGICICNKIIIGYYKWNDTFILYDANDQSWRKANKRELNVTR